MSLGIFTKCFYPLTNVMIFDNISPTLSIVATKRKGGGHLPETTPLNWAGNTSRPEGASVALHGRLSSWEEVRKNGVLDPSKGPGPPDGGPVPEEIPHKNTMDY